MRPDKKKRNRGRNSAKSEDSGEQERKNDGKNVHKAEKTQEAESVETLRNTEQNKSVTNQTPTKDPKENLPAPELRRETDALKETKKYSKRQIFSHWMTYDKPVLPEEGEEELSDFGTLIQRNVSGDAHFKFKSERQWEVESCKINQDLFTLNLEQLSAGLECIPYYQRLNLPKFIFSENELERMHNVAKEQEKKYDRLLKDQVNKKVEISTTSLFDKPIYKENADQVVDKANLSIGTQSRELVFMEMGEYLTKSDKFGLSEGILNESNVNENHLNERKINEYQSSVSKENENQVNVNEKKVQESKEYENEAFENVLGINQGKECKVEEKKVNESMATNNELKQNKYVAKDSSADSKITERDSQKEKITEAQVYLDSSAKETGVIIEKPLEIHEVKFPSKVKGAKSKTSSSKVKNIGEEDNILDCLLSLKEPTVSAIDLSKTKIEGEESEADNLHTDISSIVIHEKKENLEDWLDSMLDD